MAGSIENGEMHIVSADTGIISTGTGKKGPEEQNLPESLQNNMDLCLKFLRKILGEYDQKLLEKFNILLKDVQFASSVHWLNKDNHDKFKSEATDKLDQMTNIFNEINLDDSQMIARAFTTYFHLANLCEERYRVESYKKRQSQVRIGKEEADPVNELTVAYKKLTDEIGQEGARKLLDKLEFHPVYTAHPTEARRKAVEGKIRRISLLLNARPNLGGSDLVENDRMICNEIDALFRTSPIALRKPTPVEEADTIINVFDTTLFTMIPNVYRRFDDWLLGENAGRAKPICPAFFHPGSWIASDRDGNPNVTAKVSRTVARKFYEHMVSTLERATRVVGRNLTLESGTTPANDAMKNLWNHQKEMSERLTSKASIISVKEPHRAALIVMADRLAATCDRDADLMYNSAEDFLHDLRIVQQSLVDAGALRAAYGDLQRLIWQVETFGFHLVEMEFRQHSIVHSNAITDIREHGLNGERGDLQPMTVEVLDTFRALGSIQKRNGKKSASRYIISFTKSAQNVRDVFELNRLAFAHPEDVPALDVIPLFEQLEDLEGSVDVLNEIIKIPEVQTRLNQTNRHMEVMLGYSDSSKDAGPTTATFALHRAQEKIAKWAQDNDIDLTLFHGRGGAVGRGGGPANRAVLAQPAGSVNCRFKLTEQGEVIFARYGNNILASRHIESVAAATLLQSAPSIEKLNTDMTEKYSQMSASLNNKSHEKFLDLLNSDNFAPWFSTVTPLTEVGLLPIGSRPAKRGLGAKSLDDLRTIPWVFAWAQARINLAAWYGFGSACESFGDLETLRKAYSEWPLFSTFIDNIEMSVAKTDERIARLYLDLGDREDLSSKVLEEMKLTRKWVLQIVGDDWPLQHRHILGRAVRLRSPFVDALSLLQVNALKSLRRLSDKEELSESRQADFIFLILCTVSGVAAGLQNTG